jgi:class 3 adenylate cyclase/tetratricopeptide (TPR) repeat protein
MVVDVAAWLESLGLGQYAEAFAANDVDATLLPRLTADDLRDLGVASVGHRRRLLDAIAALGEADEPPLAPQAQSDRPIDAVRPAEAERRQLTVMFVDLVGSTALAGQLDPEDMGALIRAYQNAVAGEIMRFEGHIAKYMGDGVLAYFGWPKAHEDEAERAVRAALAVAKTVSALDAPGLTLGGERKERQPLAARVGIATGPVVVGELIGEGAAQEESVVGETPNLAARLQALAEPGAVVVAEGTRRLLGGLFELGDLGLQRVKGFAAPLRAFAVAGEATAEGRFDALRAAAGPTPLVGREQELALLLERFERAKEGEGQVVLLAGEAGIGKSRLVRALREALAAEPHTPLGHFCSPYHANTALYPVMGLLERAAGLRHDDPPERRLDKLEAALAAGTEDVAGAAPVLAELLAIPTAGRYPPLDLSPQQRKQRVFEALLDQLTGLAARSPVLALFEDVHWADPTTLELLGRIIERAQRLPVLALITFRPEFAPPWSGHGHVTALSLGRLGRRQGGAMVERVTGGKALPAEVLEQILLRTDGVPLFVEELTKTVIESGLLRDRGDRYELDGPLPPLAIPATLHDSLLARLDRLAPVKEVAQVAAVIGREFSHALLAAVAPLGDHELEVALDQLVAAELVFRRGEPGDRASYVFKHALVRDAAYESLLRSRRQQLHGRIAAALEERFPDTAVAEPELLARHCAGAGLAEAAARHWQRAAELAVARSANLEAIAHCDEAEAQLRTLPPSPARTLTELEVQLAKGIAIRAGRGYAVPEAERTFLRACELCEELGDQIRLAHGLRGLFGFYYVAGRWLDAAQVAERFRTLAEGLDNRAVQCVRWYVEGATRMYRGAPADAVHCLGEALRLYDERDRETHIRLSGHETGSLISFHLAMAEWLAGMPDRAMRTSEASLEIVRRGARPFSLALVVANGAVLRVLSREWRGAEMLGIEAHAVSVRHGIADFIAYGHLMAGTAIAARGDVLRGLALAREGLVALDRVGWQSVMPMVLARLALVLCASGDKVAATEMATEALRMARANSELIWEAEAMRVLGEVRLAAGTAGAAEVEAEWRKALEVARRQEAKSFELRVAMSLARLWAEQGKRAQAHDLLAPVYDWFTEGFDTPDLKEAKALLDELR